MTRTTVRDQPTATEFCVAAKFREVPCRHLLSRIADAFSHFLGVVVPDLQLLADLRRDAAFLLVGST
jgi:hypothetical protein